MCVGGFDSWEDYRRFVETSRSSFRRGLREQYRAGDLEVGDGSEWAASFSKPIEHGESFDDRWEYQVRQKWEHERSCFFDGYESIVRGAHFEAVQDPVERTEKAELSFHGHTEEEALVSYDDVGDRMETYLRSTPGCLLISELFLDAAASFAIAAHAADRSVRGEIYDLADSTVEDLRPVDRVLRTVLFDHVDREEFVSGSYLEELFDRLERRCERLTSLTVATARCDTEMAVTDPALADGECYPRTWKVRPTGVLSGLSGAPVDSENSTAVVTVDTESAFDVLDYFELRGYYGATVEESDEAFPATVGDHVIVAPPNVVTNPEEPSLRRPDGLTGRQRSLLADVRERPDVITEGDLSQLLEWATADDPETRRRIAGAVGPAPTTDAFDREIAGLLLETLEDPDPTVRGEAALSIGDAVADGTDRSSSLVDALVTHLEDDDESVRRAVAEAVETIADTDPRLVFDHVEFLTVGLADENPVVRHRSAWTLYHVAAADPESARPAAEALARAVDGNAPDARSPVTESPFDRHHQYETIDEETEERIVAAEALSKIATTEDGYAAVEQAVTDQLLDPLLESAPRPRYAATIGVKWLVDVDPQLVVDCGGLERFREQFERFDELEKHGGYQSRRRILITIEVLSETHLQDCLDAGLVDLAIDQVTCGDSSRYRYALDAIQTIAQNDVDPLYERDVPDLLREQIYIHVDHGSCRNLVRQALVALYRIWEANPERADFDIVEQIRRCLGSDIDDCRREAAKCVQKLADTAPSEAVRAVDPIVDTLENGSTHVSFGNALATIGARNPDALKPAIDSIVTAFDGASKAPRYALALALVTAGDCVPDDERERARDVLDSSDALESYDPEALLDTLSTVVRIDPDISPYIDRETLDRCYDHNAEGR